MQGERQPREHEGAAGSADGKGGSRHLGDLEDGSAPSERTYSRERGRCLSHAARGSRNPLGAKMFDGPRQRAGTTPWSIIVWAVSMSVSRMGRIVQPSSRWALAALTISFRPTNSSASFTALSKRAITHMSQ